MSLETSPVRLTWSPRGTVRELVLIMVSLELLAVILDLWLNYAGGVSSRSLQRLFNITREDGFGSWLAVTQAAFIAMTLWGMVWVFGRTGMSRARRAGWAVVALFFSYLAFDDGNRFHERMGSTFSDVELIAMGFPSYTWQVLFGPFLIVMGLFLLGFLWRELRTTPRRLMVLGALSLLAFAVVLDFIEGLDRDHPLNVYAHWFGTFEVGMVTQSWFGVDGLTAAVHFSKSIEECVEMMAMTMFWAVFLLHLGSTAGHLELVPTEPPAQRRPSLRHRLSRRRNDRNPAEPARLDAEAEEVVS